MFYVLIFIICCILLYFSGEWVVKGLIRTARFFGWREFVVGFAIMAFATSLPNLFVGISSALHKIPQLSFGDVVGSSVVDLTLVVALATIISKGLPAESRLIQSSALFTVFIAILPLLLIFDRVLSRGDGLLLVFVFVFYSVWLFSKKERFRKIYKEETPSIIKGFGAFLKNIGKLILGIIFLLLAAEGIVRSASFLAKNLDLPLSLVGILIVGLGTSLPEAYLAVALARKKENWLILGDLMGSVIVVSSLVLGTVALIYPIEISDFSPFAIARIFLIISALLFFVSLRTGQKITKKEALILLGIYFLFLFTEIFFR